MTFPIALLQALGTRPRVHGNGFIQLDLTDRIRLHVWGDPRIPRQATETPVHDHAFGFTSYVLRGVLENKLYTREPISLITPLHQPHRAVARHGEDTRLEPTGNTVPLWVLASQFVGAGNSYAMRAREIHETIPHGVSLSVIVKDEPTVTYGGAPPTVYVPIGVVPDNAFDRYAASPELLWQIIAEAIA